MRDKRQTFFFALVTSEGEKGGERERTRTFLAQRENLLDWMKLITRWGGRLRPWRFVKLPLWRWQVVGFEIWISFLSHGKKGKKKTCELREKTNHGAWIEWLIIYWIDRSNFNSSGASRKYPKFHFNDLKVVRVYLSGNKWQVSPRNLFSNAPVSNWHGCVGVNQRKTRTLGEAIKREWEREAAGTSHYLSGGFRHGTADSRSRFHV